MRRLQQHERVPATMRREHHAKETRERDERTVGVLFQRNAGVLAGPGTSWGRVREALREAAVVELAESTVEAIDETLTGEMIRCAEPLLGRPEGYPLICLEPGDEAIAVVAYHAESAVEYLEQAWALVRRNFREGPHELLGRAPAVALASTRGNVFGLLIDGEAAEAPARAEFVLAACEVDLLATAPDAR